MNPDLLGLVTAPSGPPTSGQDCPFILAVLNTTEAAKYLRLPAAVLTTEAEEGRIPGRKIGAEWRFLVLALTEWLRSGQKVEPKKPSLEEWLRRNPGEWTKEKEQEVEREVAELYALRKSWGAVGESGAKE
jgi:Helix-turn-helix domain